MKQSYPLTDGQRRKLTVFLSLLEQELEELRRQLAQPPRDLHLTVYAEPIPPKLRPAPETALTRAQDSIAQLARDLDLSPTEQSAHRSALSQLQISAVELSELTAKGGLRGYGAVAAPTAEYLESAIPELKSLLENLTRLLAHGKLAKQPESKTPQ